MADSSPPVQTEEDLLAPFHEACKPREAWRIGTEAEKCGVYADGSSTAITTEVQWSSGDDTVLTIDGNGLATGVKVGSTAVTAFVNSAQVRASAAVKVQ